MYNAEFKATSRIKPLILQFSTIILIFIYFVNANIALAQSLLIKKSSLLNTDISSTYLSLGEKFHFQYAQQIQTLIPSSTINTINSDSLSSFESTIILRDEKEHNIKLKEVQLLESDFKCILDDHQNPSAVEIKKGKHFQGVVDNDNMSLITMDFYNSQIHGMLVRSQVQRYVLHADKLEDHTLLNIQQSIEEDFHAPSCNTNDWDHYLESSPQLETRTKETCKRTLISIRADYELYLKFNKNPQLITNYIIGLFNQVNAIYRKEEIQISISEIVINTVPDGFLHTSSNSDLNTLKTKYKNFKGNIQLCLSGYTNKGKATLGGVAYINSLCLKSYAFAFANIEGNFKSYQEYSYDVFLAAHELGHVFGSRHTHACVWGPNKNQALDNCAITEGGCTPGAKPIKGSIMSYCQLTGNPGVDLLIGFGKEPGDLIRQNVNNSNCLVSYSPTNNFITKADQHITANVECFDGVNTNYYFDNNTSDESDDILIASIQKNGQNIGNIANESLLVRAHTTKTFGNGTCSSLQVNYLPTLVHTTNRYWEIKSNAVLEKNVKITLFANQIDLQDLKSKEPKITPEMLNILAAQNPGDANPDNRQVSLNKLNTNVFSNGKNTLPNQWSILKFGDGSFSLDFQTKTLNSYSLFYSKGNNLNDPSSRENQAKSNPTAWLSSQSFQSKELYLNYNNSGNQIYKLEARIINLNGQVESTLSFLAHPGQNSFPIPTESMVNGIYMINFWSINENECIKFTITQ